MKYDSETQHFNICHPLLLYKNLKITRTLEVCIIGLVRLG